MRRGVRAPRHAFASWCRARLAAVPRPPGQTRLSGSQRAIAIGGILVLSVATAEPPAFSSVFRGVLTLLVCTLLLIVIVR